jgi:hypothetical protein
MFHGVLQMIFSLQHEPPGSIPDAEGVKDSSRGLSAAKTPDQIKNDPEGVAEPLEMIL